MFGMSKPIRSICFNTSFLRQEYSWGRLLVTQSTFDDLLKAFDALPALKKYVSYFGFKSSDANEHFATYERRIHLSDSIGQEEISHHGNPNAPFA